MGLPPDSIVTVVRCSNKVAGLPTLFRGQPGHRVLERADPGKTFIVS